MAKDCSSLVINTYMNKDVDLHDIFQRSQVELCQHDGVSCQCTQRNQQRCIEHDAPFSPLLKRNTIK